MEYFVHFLVYILEAAEDSRLGRPRDETQAGCIHSTSRFGQAIGGPCSLTRCVLRCIVAASLSLSNRGPLAIVASSSSKCPSCPCSSRKMFNVFSCCCCCPQTTAKARTSKDRSFSFLYHVGNNIRRKSNGCFSFFFSRVPSCFPSSSWLSCTACVTWNILQAYRINSTARQMSAESAYTSVHLPSHKRKAPQEIHPDISGGNNTTFEGGDILKFVSIIYPFSRVSRFLVFCLSSLVLYIPSWEHHHLSYLAPVRTWE